MKKLIFLYVFIGLSVVIYYFPHATISPSELSAAHQNLNNNCFSCHTPLIGVPNNKCIECHKLSEIGKDTLVSMDSISLKKVLFHKGFANQSCVACHTEHQGIQPTIAISKFEHALVSKEIINNCLNCHEVSNTSIHKQVSTDCKSCHNTIDWKSITSFNHNMILGDTKNDCISCHQSPKNVVHEMSGTNCTECHNTTKWTPATFNHNKILSGAKNTCISCHESPKDSFHEGAGTNCTECHSIAKWVPSTFNHEAYFILDKNHNSSCITCHSNNNFKTYTCYGCHEHSETKIRNEHLEEGIRNFENCVSCHKSGNEHDIRMNYKSNGEGNNSHENKKKYSGKNEDDEDDEH
jgi:hypothetical protein